MTFDRHEMIDVKRAMGDPTSQPARHLQVIRDLLARDYLARADWSEALAGVAAAARDAVGAREAMVALWESDGQRWQAVASSGARIDDEDIACHGSRSVLDRVRSQRRPVLTMGDDEIAIDSESIHVQNIAGVLAVPLQFWDVERPRAVREFGGCLYAHRTPDRPGFTPADVAIVEDIARIAEPTLNVLRHLRHVQEDLEVSRREASELRRLQARQYRFGESTLPFTAYDTLSRIAGNKRVTLLILGPTGSGKSHLARAYHFSCPRRDRPFVVLDCGSVTSAETLGAELFGYAPTSGYANAPKGGSLGKARMAHEGTLFIDEVANLALDLQPRLLRLIQEGRFSPLGGASEERVDIQILAATNADLAARVAAGTFREDLLHRLDVVSVTLPGLGERAGEIPELCRDILGRVCEEAGRSIDGLTPAAMEAVIAHHWDGEGNIRGIENLLRRSVWSASAGCEILDAPDLRWAGAPTAVVAGSELRVTRPPRTEDDELERVRDAIRTHRNAAEAAKALGLTYRQLYWRLQKAGLSVRDVLAGR